ncbi:hypothetical protein GJW-30_1_03520 [Variibacter gotjawalensis]|uniref:YicC-like family, N-terminal region n=1 Tax=Variibacter gotjawalensis TaxID=1333996 RepID=A0A0S3PYE0_9BRAD|nr:YicC/YloC family endoribonuclease [Variibacter gotjawalensis]NIK46807.1 uncharacterized protein (TIGR00255 family) [Variibacter gotjawalensis]RZS48711.1 uncharacterized protein (TIGR00255 family) [Variibacter gotjawalensis]BAT60970.1 hypothetical protein GJW-30_1_03520 [Variibacter gotjawalensis]
MTLSSMTGFSRQDGTAGPYAWSWELKSVNGKGLEVRLRFPPGWDSVEVPVRAQSKALARGTVHANLSIRRDGAAPQVKINQAVLDAVVEAIRQVEGKIESRPPSIDGLLAIKGVLEVSDDADVEADRRAAETSVVSGFASALDALMAMRRVEGEALGRILTQRLDEIAALTGRAEALPARQPEAIKAKLAEQINALMETPGRFDSDRLHQEAILIATKVDIREELDRLVAHIAQARSLLGEGGAIGRRLDFLAQEFNREVNTLCSKSNDVALTTIGLELKNVVEQFREQVQNLE